MTDGFVSHWENVATKPDDPEFESARKFVDTPKVVFTKTLDKSLWKNTVLAKGPLTDRIYKLKRQEDGTDIIVLRRRGVCFLPNKGRAHRRISSVRKSRGPWGWSEHFHGLN